MSCLLSVFQYLIGAFAKQYEDYHDSHNANYIFPEIHSGRSGGGGRERIGGRIWGPKRGLELHRKTNRVKSPGHLGLSETEAPTKEHT